MLKINDEEVRAAYIGNKPVREIYSGRRLVYQGSYLTGKLVDYPTYPWQGRVDGIGNGGALNIDEETLEFDHTLDWRMQLLFESGYQVSALFQRIKFRGRLWMGSEYPERFAYMSYLEELDISRCEFDDDGGNFKFQPGFCARDFALKTVRMADVKIETPRDEFDIVDWFVRCENLETVDMRRFDFSKASLVEMFGGCHNLTSLNMSGCDFSNVMMLNICNNESQLTDLRFGENLCCSTTFCTWPLSHESAVSVINGLGNVNKETVEFSAYTFNRLTAEDIALATSKGWTVASA